MNLRFIAPGLFFLLISFATTAQNDSRADTTKIQTNSTEDIVFEKVDIEAAFPGGDMVWRSYLEKNVNGMIPADNGAPNGVYTVIVQFIVDKEGNISNVRALTKHGYGMEEEVVRIITTGPKWVPAVQNGKVVKAYRKQPITFVVTEGKSKRNKNKNKTD